MTATSEDPLRLRSNITSVRGCLFCPATVSERVCRKSLCDQRTEDFEYFFSLITPAVGEWQEEGGQPLSLTIWTHLRMQVKRKKSNISPLCEGLEPALFGRVEGVFLVQTFVRKAAGIPCTSCPWKVDSRPPVEGCAWCNSYRQTQCTWIQGWGKSAFFFFFEQCHWLSASFELLKGWFQEFGEVFFWFFIFEVGLRMSTVWSHCQF